MKNIVCSGGHDEQVGTKPPWVWMKDWNLLASEEKDALKTAWWKKYDKSSFPRWWKGKRAAEEPPGINYGMRIDYNEVERKLLLEDESLHFEDRSNQLQSHELSLEK